MVTKPQALKIARTVVGICVAAGLIYFLYSKKSPPAVSWLISLAVVFFVRRAGVYEKNPYLRRLAMVSSRKPLRDFGLAVACFVATMVVTIGISIAVRDKVLPDNYVTAGLLIVAIVVGMLGILFFISGVIGRAFYGPPPP